MENKEPAKERCNNTINVDVHDIGPVKCRCKHDKGHMNGIAIDRTACEPDNAELREATIEILVRKKAWELVVARSAGRVLREHEMINEFDLLHRVAKAYLEQAVK
jgi:hypothetical protein